VEVEEEEEEETGFSIPPISFSRDPIYNPKYTLQ